MRRASPCREFVSWALMSIFRRPHVIVHSVGVSWSLWLSAVLTSGDREEGAMTMDCLDSGAL